MPKHGACTVELDIALSVMNPCVLNTSFGCLSEDRMYVTNRCRGKFTCNGNILECGKFSHFRWQCPCGSTSKPLARGTRGNEQYLNKKLLAGTNPKSGTRVAGPTVKLLADTYQHKARPKSGTRPAGATTVKLLADTYQHKASPKNEARGVGSADSDTWQAMPMSANNPRELFRLASLSLCPSPIWFELVHKSLPCLQTFIDVVSSPHPADLSTLRGWADGRVSRWASGRADDSCKKYVRLAPTTGLTAACCVCREPTRD